MTAKNQITLPKKITDVLGLKKGSMFNVEVTKEGIELIPLEVKERGLTKAEYDKLEAITGKEKGKEKILTNKFINDLKKGRD